MISQRDYDMADYPWWLFTRVAGHVEHGDHVAAHVDLDQVLDRMEVEHGPELAPRKMRCAAILSHCLRGAYRGGAPGEPVLVDYMQTLDAMATRRSWPGVRTLMHASLESLIAQVQSQQRGDVERLVDHIRRQIRDSPEALLTLAQYAYDNHVNADYLSRRFHEIAGQTFCAERRYFRIEHARRLLESSSLKVRVVAWRVGIRDTSHFIREFRTITGQTPGQYRRGISDQVGSTR